ncbi:hypothetical protein EYC80_006148 [Monilinia laxa]|uniref:Uncharacterized protein n=1 Tax=Monilinia laxa TaxID=61186 RepID=A0A5N6KGA5_MONLA|nr:hypothetical protein EYC80_006148 [Monilinia laxa]
MLRESLGPLSFKASQLTSFEIFRHVYIFRGDNIWQKSEVIYKSNSKLIKLPKSRAVYFQIHQIESTGALIGSSAVVNM